MIHSKKNKKNVFCFIKYIVRKNKVRNFGQLFNHNYIYLEKMFFLKKNSMNLDMRDHLCIIKF